MPPLAGWQQSPYRAMRQNALRQLIAISPDLLLSSHEEPRCPDTTAAATTPAPS